MFYYLPYNPYYPLWSSNLNLGGGIHNSPGPLNIRSCECWAFQGLFSPLVPCFKDTQDRNDSLYESYENLISSLSDDSYSVPIYKGDMLLAFWLWLTLQCWVRSPEFNVLNQSQQLIRTLGHLVLCPESHLNCLERFQAWGAFSLVPEPSLLLSVAFVGHWPDSWSASSSSLRFSGVVVLP
jgi:hypothetical protein